MPRAPLPEGAHLAVIGAGISGSACALEAVRRGWRVTLIDAAPPGERGPSRGNAAHIAAADVLPLSAPDIALTGLRMLMRSDGALKIPLSELPSMAPWLWRFWRAGKGEAYERAQAAIATLAAEALPALETLAAEAGATGLIGRSDVLYLYESEAGFRAAADGWARRRAAGVQAELLDAAALRALEPALAPIFPRAIRADRWGVAADPLMLTKAFAEAALARGAAWRQGAVRAVTPTDTGITLAMPEGHLDADAVLIAGGVWSTSLARGLGDTLPLAAERGYNITCPDPGPVPATPVVFTARGVVGTRLPQGYRLGGWAEFAGTSRPPDPRWFTAMHRIARTVVPGLDTSDATEWMGHRPATPDSVPILSRSPRHPRVFYACGHGHYGLTWAGVTARITGDLLGGGEAPAYDLRRFA